MFITEDLTIKYIFKFMKYKLVVNNCYEKNRNQVFTEAGSTKLRWKKGTRLTVISFRELNPEL